MAKYVVVKCEDDDLCEQAIQLCKSYGFDVDEPDMGGVSQEDSEFLLPMMNGAQLDTVPHIFFVDDGESWYYVSDNITELQTHLDSLGDESE